jgi:hypothetical protein
MLATLQKIKHVQALQPALQQVANF